MDLRCAIPMVIETLQRASSQNSEILKPAEQKLKEWEVEPGFYSILLNIISNHSLDLNVRWLAVLFFKNGIDRYWRKTAPNAIQEEEKAHLRVGMMGSFTEPVNQVAVQLAVLISKAARYDVPREWPTFMPDLLSKVGSNDVLIQHRGLLTLHHVIKMFSSKVLPEDRLHFRQLTADVFTFVLNVWNVHLENFCREVQQGNEQCHSSLEKALLSLKILRKFTVYGYKEPHESEDVVLFVNSVFDRAKLMLECRKTLITNGVNSNLIRLIEQFITQLTKVHISLIDNCPDSYVTFLHSALVFTVNYVFTAQGDGLLFERFIIQCLNLIKSVLLMKKRGKFGYIYSHEKTSVLNKAEDIKSEFFQTGTVSDICRKLITHYFLLTKEDLELWDSDPETFASEEGGESWKYNLRPCTESLFCSLQHKYRDTITPVILELVRTNHHIVEPDDIDGILRKDAVYNAAGLAAFNLYDEVNFDEWFTTTLSQELKISAPNYRIIRRRIAWLIKEWASVDFSDQMRPVIYRTLLTLLQGNEDMAIRLTAAVALKFTIDDISFTREQFLEFLEPFWVSLFTLLKECKECDSKMQVLYVCSFMIERVGSAIAPYAVNLVEYLPLLWEESAEHNMLRCAIVSTLVPFVKSGVNDVLWSFLIPVIHISTDVEQESHVYLLEDGLELWLAAVKNTSSLFPALMKLFANMIPILELTTEHLKVCMKIVKAYVILDPVPFLTEYGEVLLSTCFNMLTDVNPDGCGLILKMFETVIRAEPKLGIQLIIPFMPRIFKEVCLHKSRKHLVTEINLCIICRLLLSSKELFCQILHTAAAGETESVDSYLSILLQSWLEEIELVSGSKEKKLLALGLCSLLTIESSVVVDKFCGILLMVTQVLYDITETDDMGVQTDSLIVCEGIRPSRDAQRDEDDEENVVQSDHDVRKYELFYTDPVTKVVLQHYLQTQIEQLKIQLGEYNYAFMVDTVDVETLQQARTFVPV